MIDIPNRPRSESYNTKNPNSLPSTLEEYPTAYINLPKAQSPPATVAYIGYFTPATKIKKHTKKTYSTKLRWAL